IIGQGRASELLYTGRVLRGDQAEQWGFFNELCPPHDLQKRAHELAATLASGPTFAHAMTKRSLHEEWDMGIDDAIDKEAETQAICMQTEDFVRAYRGFVAKERPRFEGN
ncbi:MAG TPA: enoyl-CoA hydratase-related protein, partial [Longimicrobiales bacterium]